MGLDEFVKGLAAYGAPGLVAVGLLFAVRTLWRKNEELQAKLGSVQEARISERDALVKALNDQTRVTAEVVEILASRRRL